jgi:hypothetical protein
MRRHFILAFAAAVAATGCGRSNQGTAARDSDIAATPVTLIGCLVPGASGTSPGAVGTAGTTAADGFTLVDTTTTSTAGADASTGSSAAAATGTSGTGVASGGRATVDTGTPRSYALIGGKQEELQKYVNMRVEVRGAVVTSTDTGMGVPDVGAASAPAGTPATDVQRVRVDHVRQLDSTCSSGSKR